MNCRLPELKDKDILKSYVQEHYANHENSISASMGLSSSDYAAEMLDHALTVCREKGMKKVILGCDKNNTASASTIKKTAEYYLLKMKTMTRARSASIT